MSADETPPSRFIVTGAEGFIGGCLIRHLRSLGLSVTGVGRVARTDAVDAVVDLRDPAALAKRLDEGTAIFHLAGNANIRTSIATPAVDFEENVVASFAVLEAARKAKCRVVFPSTASVYSSQAALPFRESAPLGPRSPYAAAKLAAEAYCSAYHHSFGLDTRVARIFSVYGPGMRRLAIHDFVSRLEQDPKRLILWGNGQQTRDYLYVDDAVRALHLIALKGRAGEVYNVGSGERRTVIDVARGVAAAMGLSDCEVAGDGRHSEAESDHMQADIGRLSALGFRVDTSFEQGLQTTVSWLREHQKQGAG